MQKLKSSEPHILEHYHESWWKVKDQPIWYLAGKDGDEEYLPGKWYFTNEADMFSAAFNTYEDCKKALDTSEEYLVL